MQQFTKQEFLSTTKPYEYLLQIKGDPPQYEQALATMQENARIVGVRNFLKIYASYVASL